MTIRRAIPVVLLLSVAAASAGTLTTVDGTQYTGVIKRNDDGYTITQDDGVVQAVPLRRVKSIQLGGDDAAKPGHELAGLKSLRRSVEYSDDLTKIVQRYQAFIATTKDPAVVAQANTDLTQWLARQDKGLVKFGRSWVTPADRDAAVRAARQKAEDARLMIKAGRLPEAQKAVNELLDADPQNVSALYLAGVLAQNRKDLGEAKKNFAALQQLVPQHPPTLLNLALINFRQKQWAAANIALEQALEAAPVTQTLLDTTAELLNATPPAVRQTKSAQSLAKTFFAQDAELQKQMAVRHMHRWGSGWVDDATWDKIQKANEQIGKKIAELQKQFDDTQQRITTNDTRIAANEQTMRSLEANSYMRLSNGKIVQTPLPTAYYTLQTENTQLQSQQDQDRRTLADLQTQAKQVRTSLPVPPYTGTMTPVNEDGVPLTVLPSASQPAAPTPSIEADPVVEPPAAATGPSVIRIGPPE